VCCILVVTNVQLSCDIVCCFETLTHHCCVMARLSPTKQMRFKESSTIYGGLCDV
jgi:hypothetical protein